jgi:hypothetical protein
MPRRGEFGVSRVLVAISHEMREIDEKVVLDGDYGDEIVSSALMETATGERWGLSVSWSVFENVRLQSVTYWAAGC